MRYFIVYRYDHFGVGNLEIDTEETIKGIKDIQKLEDLISLDKGFTGVVIINWKRFD